MGAGLLMVIVASLNLLNRANGCIAPGVRVVCIAASWLILAFAVAGGLSGRAGVMQWILVLGIIVPMTALSFSREVHEPDAA